MKWKRATVVMGLVAVAVCLAGQPDDAPYLLETGLYMEQTVGDLDRAIEAYRRIVEKAEAQAPYVARAYYRLGRCYLKKGQDDQAAEAFRKLLERYPDRKELAGKARKELQKLETAEQDRPRMGTAQAPESGAWRTVTLPPESGSKKILDLSTGDLVTEAETRAESYLMIETMKKYGHFVFYSSRTRNLIFPKGTILPKGTESLYGFSRASADVVGRRVPDQIFGKNPQPVTWTITTTAGDTYEIVILKASEESVRLRFRRVRPALPSRVGINEEVTRPLKGGVYLDLETAEALERSGQTPDEKVRTWAQPRGCDLGAWAGRRMVAFLTPWLVPLEERDWEGLKLQELALRIGLREGALPDEYAKRVQEVQKQRALLEEANAQLEQAERDRERWAESYKLAQQTFERAEQLVRSGAASSAEAVEPRQEMLKARSQLNSIEAEMERLLNRIRKLESSVEDGENALTAAVLAGQLDAPSRPLPVQFRLIPDGDDLPVTYGLRTLQGSFAVLQVTAVQDRLLSVRYRLLSSPARGAAPARRETRQARLRAIAAQARTRTIASMRSLGVALATYRGDHDGEWPDTLQQLVDEHYVKLESPDQLDQFVYRAGDLPADSELRHSKTVVLHERYEKWPEGGLTVLFADAHVETIESEKAFKELLAASKRGPNTTEVRVNRQQIVNAVSPAGLHREKTMFPNFFAEQNARRCVR